MSYEQSNVTVRLTTPEDEHLPAYRYTQLNTTNQCPTLGALQFMGRKYGEQNGNNAGVSDSQAMYAGRVCHDAFAAVRLVAGLLNESITRQQFEHHGVRLFGEERWHEMHTKWSKADGLIRGSQIMALAALETSNYVESSADSKRSYANLEASLLAYVNHYDWNRRVWSGGVHADSLIGVEITFDLTILVDDVPVARYQGTIDGIGSTGNGLPEVEENKTGAALNDAWALAFTMSHQVTGYMLAGHLLTNQPVSEGRVIGLQIPVKLTQPVRTEFLFREPHHHEQWMRWFLHSAAQFENAAIDPARAPKYSHACNRYFRACEYLQFCLARDEDKDETLDFIHNGNIDIVGA